jgi:hypothetical protein
MQVMWILLPVFLSQSPMFFKMTPGRCIHIAGLWRCWQGDKWGIWLPDKETIQATRKNQEGPKKP